MYVWSQTAVDRLCLPDAAPAGGGGKRLSFGTLEFGTFNLRGSCNIERGELDLVELGQSDFYYALSTALLFLEEAVELASDSTVTSLGGAVAGVVAVADACC